MACISIIAWMNEWIYRWMHKTSGSDCGESITGASLKPCGHVDTHSLQPKCEHQIISNIGYWFIDWFVLPLKDMWDYVTVFLSFVILSFVILSFVIVICHVTWNKEFITCGLIYIVCLFKPTASHLLRGRWCEVVALLRNMSIFIVQHACRHMRVSDCLIKAQLCVHSLSHTHTHTHAHAHTHTHTHTHTHILSHTHTHTHILWPSHPPTPHTPDVLRT